MSGKIVRGFCRLEYAATNNHSATELYTDDGTSAGVISTNSQVLNTNIIQKNNPLRI